MMDLQRKTQGFSLLEVLLVLAIMATIMVAILGYTTQKSDEMRRDRTVMQMEQFLNAGLSYYVSFGSWPTLANLQGNFLPSGTIKNPWGQTFSVGSNTTGTSPGSEFSVCTTIIGQQAYSAATVIAGRLPMASAIDGTVSCPTASTTACTAGSSTCTVVSSVNIPGQNLNNARSINFAGLYHNSACVPAPVCPSNMIPSIMAVPVSVSGMNDGISTVYPISSFTAYVRGADANGNPGQFPASCSDASSYPACYADMPPPPTPYTGLPTGKYWRVCLRIITEKGLLTYSSTTKDAGIVLVLTRCSPANEYTTPSVYGSKFTVFWP